MISLLDRNRVHLFLGLSLLAAIICPQYVIAGLSVDHQEDFPFPVASQGINASMELALIVTDGMPNDEVLCLTALQGILAQTKPTVYIMPPNPNGARRSDDPHWSPRISGRNVFEDETLEADLTMNFYQSYRLWWELLQSHWNISVSAVEHTFPRALELLITQWEAHHAQHSAPRSTPARPANNFSISKTISYILVNETNTSVLVGLQMCAIQPTLCLVLTENVLRRMRRDLSHRTLVLYKDVRGETPGSYFLLEGMNSTAARPTNLVLLQNPISLPCLADYISFSKAATWFNDLFPPSEGSVECLARLGETTKPAAALGWGVDEEITVAGLSLFGAGMVASDHAMNLAVLTNFREASSPSQGVSDNNHNSLAEHREVTSLITGTKAGDHHRGKPQDSHWSGCRPDQHIVSFVFTDGDNVQWILGGFLEKRWFGSLGRGQVPLTWTMSSSLPRLAAPAWLYLSKLNATANDSFIGAPSGYVYSYWDAVETPAKAQIAAAESVAALHEIVQGGLQPTSKKKPLLIQNVIGLHNSVSGASPSLLPLFDAGADAVLYYPFSDYCGIGGQITYITETTNSSSSPSSSASSSSLPLLLTAKACLWSPGNNHSHFGVAGMVELLRRQPADWNRAEGYSIIPVHVWSHTLDDVLSLVSELRRSEGDRYCFVSLDNATKLMRENLQI